MADTNVDKILKDLEKALKAEEKEYKEYEKWVKKMDKEDYTDLEWEDANNALDQQAEYIRILELQIWDVSTNG